MSKKKGRNRFQSEVVAILDTVERELLGILANAASSGDYEAIDLCRTTAAKVKILAREIGRPGVAKENSLGGFRKPRSRKAKRIRTSRRTPSGKPSGYPKYEIDDGALHKVGWSKKARKEYSHRVPLDSVNEIAKDIRTCGESHGRITMELILFDGHLRSNDCVPGYQVYVVLAFLRDREAIKPAGRGGYSISEKFEGVIRSELSRRGAKSNV